MLKAISTRRWRRESQIGDTLWVLTGSKVRCFQGKYLLVYLILLFQENYTKTIYN